jgi:hypothetical protein
LTPRSPSFVSNANWQRTPTTCADAVARHAHIVIANWRQHESFL